MLPPSGKSNTGVTNISEPTQSDTSLANSTEKTPRHKGCDLDDRESTQTCVFTYFSLEAAEELGQVGVFPGQGKDPFLSEGAVHVIILQDHVFLQHFDGVHLITAFQLCQHHLVT